MKFKLLLSLCCIFVISHDSFAKTDKVLLKDSIRISLDTINPKISSWGDYVVQITKQNGKIVTVFRIDASSNDLGELKKMKLKNDIVYVLPIYELLVGYDYFFVIQAHTLKYYITHPFNYNQEKYVLNDKFYLTKKPYYLTILHKNKIVKVFLHPYVH